MDAHGAVLNPLSKRIIGCGLRVAGTLGNGFLEKVYENALAHELRKAGLGVEQQRGITVMYDGVMVGEYFIDLLVEASILVELKTVAELKTPLVYQTGPKTSAKSGCSCSMREKRSISGRSLPSGIMGIKS
jgi:GxxExxY protein